MAICSISQYVSYNRTHTDIHYTYKKILGPTQRFEEGPQNYGKYFMPPKAMVLRGMVTLLRAAGASCRFGFVCLGLGMVRAPGMNKSPRSLGGLICGVGYAEINKVS